MLLLICLIAFALRLGPLYDNRFHPDEALFSTWALKIARGENLLLGGVPIDKPPLLIYLSAVSFYVFGQSELAARLPNLIASVISVPLLYQLARARRAGQVANTWALIAASLLALSPFAILFAPTAFLDPAMVMFGLAALVAAARGRAGWAGLLLGLSLATKVQGLFFVPLLFVFWTSAQSQPPLHHSALRFMLSFGLMALTVLLLDRARGGLPFWVQQTINYGDLRVSAASELGPRLSGWLNFLPYFFGPIVGALGVIGLPLLSRDFKHETPRPFARIDLGLLAYAIGFIALHGLLTFPVWDRYLLILVPVLALLLGRVLYHFVTVLALHRVPPALSLALLALAVLPFSFAAAESQYPVGGDHGANDGIDQVARYLKSLPPGAVVYDHGLAWELGYYLGDGFAYLAYFDTPAALATDVRVFAAQGGERYVIIAAHETPERLIDAIGQVGYTLTPVFATQNRLGQTSFTVYRIVKRET